MFLLSKPFGVMVKGWREMSGKLILVVGPSGAGKDTLLGLAMERFSDSHKVRFPKRKITRPTDGATEDHEPISRAEFDHLLAEDDYTLAWEAHGLGYVIPSDAKRLLKSGKSVVCNVSRGVLPEAIAKFPDCIIVVITADRAIRARRLASRGRESLEDISSRLAREAAPVPAGASAITIDNSGHLAESTSQFCAALLTAVHNPSNEPAPA